VEYVIREYPLQQGALEIAYIEEFFNEFPKRKTTAEILSRLDGRESQILMAEAPLPDDPSAILPVSYKVSHELLGNETDPSLVDLVHRLGDAVEFNGRRILYNWLGATRMDWRGQGHFRALTEEQEVWAVSQGYDEVVVKTKNPICQWASMNQSTAARPISRGRLSRIRWRPFSAQRCCCATAWGWNKRLPRLSVR
jgi:hypothetical protein